MSEAGKIFGEVLELSKPPGPETCLADLGLEDLEDEEVDVLIFRLNRELGVELTIEDLWEAKTLVDLCWRIEALKILPGVKIAIIAALNLEGDVKIPRSATLFDRLGAVKCDCLDIDFQLRHEFRELPDCRHFFPVAVLQQQSEFVRQGQMVSSALKHIRENMPWLHLPPEDEMTAIHFLDHFTVFALAEFVARTLAPHK